MRGAAFFLAALLAFAQTALAEEPYHNRKNDGLGWSERFLNSSPWLRG